MEKSQQQGQCQPEQPQQQLGASSPHSTNASTASQGSAGSLYRISKVSIENVELLEADRRSIEKQRRSKFVNEPPSALPPNDTSPSHGLYGAVGYSQQGYNNNPAPAAFPNEMNTSPNFFVTHYNGSPGSGRQPSNGQNYQGGGAFTPNSNSPRGNSPHSQSKPVFLPSAGHVVNEYTLMFARGNATHPDTSYGSVGGAQPVYPRGSPPSMTKEVASHRGVTTSTMDNIEKSLNANYSSVSGAQPVQPRGSPPLTPKAVASNRGYTPLTMEDVEKSLNAYLGSVIGAQQVHPRGSPPLTHKEVASNRAFKPLTIDDIEKSLDVLDAALQKYPAPGKVCFTEVKTKGPSAENKTRGAPSGKSPLPHPHHRTTSNSVGGVKRKNHRRVGSTGNLPPAGPRNRSPIPGARKKVDEPGRSRNHLGSGSSDHQSLGGGSVASYHSIVSDISKSAMFQKVTEDGKVQLRFPHEAVRLVNYKELQSGRLYMQRIPASKYEFYHLVAEDITNGWEIGLDSEKTFKDYCCACTCNNCNGCMGKRELLPPVYYALRVDDNVYRRLLDEIAAAHSMPCGLFYCGHHEDVSVPSIRIAATILLLLLVAMAYVAFAIRI